MTAQFTRMEPNGPKGKGLEDWGGIPAASLESGTPQQSGLSTLDEKSTGMSAGVWACTAFTGKMDAYSVHEFMTLLEGSVTIVHKDGSEVTVNAGESLADVSTFTARSLAASAGLAPDLSSQMT